MPILLELEDDRSEKVHYNNPGYPIYIQRGLLSAYPDHTAPSHWHDDVELIMVLSGEMSYHVNGKIINLSEGNGIFVNARQIHFGFSLEGTECDFICVLLHPVLLCATDSYERDFVMPVVTNAAMPCVLLDEQISWQRKILEQIFFLYTVRDQKTLPLNAQSAFSAIWSLLCGHTPQLGSAPELPDADLAIVRDMTGFIQKNYMHKISLRDIAAAGAVGQSKCCKVFAKYFGQTPNGYLTRYRLNKSMELLRYTDLSVTEIALSTGFGGPSYYAETFRKWLGKSPTEFKKETLSRNLEVNGEEKNVHP